MQIEFTNKIATNSSVVIFFYKGLASLSSEDFLDKETLVKIKENLLAINFEGKEKEVISFFNLKGTDFSHIICVGLGDKRQLSAKKLQEAGAIAIRSALHIKTASLYFLTSSKEEAVNAGFGAILGSYSFDKYKTSQEEKDKVYLKQLFLTTQDYKEAENNFKHHQAISEGIYVARDIISEPGNVIYPETFVKTAKEALAKTEVEIEVLSAKDLQKLGANMLLSVAQGSEKEAKLLILKWRGDKRAKDFPLALVGKGVCFDTGGISLKPAKGMEDMKYDMAGAAAVFGTILSLAKRKAKVNVVGIMPLVENMPSGSATRPGDIVTSLSGKTVEIINTDAEGRLILGDALTYAEKTFKPKTIIDLATLTGAIKYVLASTYAGLFSNNADLEKELIKAGEATDEKLWAFPMDDSFGEHMKSDIADLRNIGDIPEGGSITAAKFLENFISKDTAWAHLDIAGTAWDSKGHPLTPKGAVGFGIRLLNEYIEDNYC